LLLPIYFKTSFPNPRYLPSRLRLYARRLGMPSDPDMQMLLPSRGLPSIAVQVRKDHSLEYCKLNFCRNTLLILARRTCTSAARRQTWIGPWVVGATGLLRYLPRPCETGILFSRASGYLICCTISGLIRCPYIAFCRKYNIRIPILVGQCLSAQLPKPHLYLPQPIDT
jgi:hypothetical protein